jgi:hypothetical protein
MGHRNQESVIRVQWIGMSPSHILLTSYCLLLTAYCLPTRQILAKVRQCKIGTHTLYCEGQDVFGGFINFDVPEKTKKNFSDTSKFKDIFEFE